MRTLRPASIVLFVVITTTTPAAIAGWSAMGSHEPDTAHDATDHLMFTSPYTVGTENRVYFNGFRDAVGAGVVNAGPNPNLATAGTQLETPSYRYIAMLGVWKDCNGDGFVGLGDQGLWEYPAAIPQSAGGVNKAICKQESVPATIPDGWMPVHNDGQWIHEFIPIGWTPSGATADPNPWNINDNASRAWYDFGWPEENNGGGTCVINPPAGSMHSSGGLVYWLDCFGGYPVTDALQKGHDNGLDYTAAGQISFSDANRTQYASSSKLNQKNPWGEQSDASYVKTWDCSSPKAFEPRDPTGHPGEPGQLWRVHDPTYNDNGTSDPKDDTKTFGDDKGNQNVTFDDGDFAHGVNVSAPSTGTPSPNAGGSPAGTANATLSGTDQCDRRTDGGGVATAPRGVVAAPARTVANAPYSQELETTQTPAKTNADGAFYGDQQARPRYEPVVASTQVPEQKCVTPPSRPTVCQAIPIVGGQWFGDVGSVLANVTGPGTPRPTTLVAHAGSPEGFWRDQWTWTSPGFAQGNHVTFYASVSQAAIDAYGLTVPGLGVYGSEPCGSDTAHVLNGFDCDASHWYKDTGGKDASYRSSYLGKDQASTGPCTVAQGGEDTSAASRGCIEISPFPGDTYNLRDIDCSDDSVMAVRAVTGERHVDSPDPTGTVGGVNTCANVS